ncbi:MAG: hypothetical protein R2731_05990 [Nocardioides sp.]
MTSIARLAGQLRAQLAAVADDVERTATAWRGARAELLAEATPADDRDIALLERVASTELPPRRRGPCSSGRRPRPSGPATRRGAALPSAAGLPGRRDGRPVGAGPGGRHRRAAGDGRPCALRRSRVAAGRRSRRRGGRRGGVPPLRRQRRAGGGAWRQSHALASAGHAVAPDSLDRADQLAAEAERLAAGHPGMLANALDLRWRLAAARGDLGTALALARHQAELPGLPPRLRLGALASVCDLLTDLQDFAGLEASADRLGALAAEAGDPFMVALGRRFLGLAWVETGRYADGAALLEDALPELGAAAPGLVGQTQWALGAARAGLREWAAARQSYAAAARAFQSEQRLGEAGGALLRAGHAAWEATDLAAARADYAAALELATRAGDADTALDAARGGALARGRSGDVDGALVELDGLPDRLGALLDAPGPTGPGWDPDTLRPALLRQGALLLDECGRHDEAAARYGDAELAVTDDMVLAQVLRAERGAALARAGRLEDADRVLRQTLSGMSADALAPAGSRPPRPGSARSLRRGTPSRRRPCGRSSVLASDQAASRRRRASGWYQRGPTALLPPMT